MPKKKDKRIPLAGGSYEEQSKNLNAQKSVNWYPVGTKEGKTEVALYPTPGWTRLLYDGGNTHYNHERPLVYSPVLDRFVYIGNFKTGPATHTGAIKLSNPEETNNANITFYTNFVGSMDAGGRGMYAGINAGSSYLSHDLVSTEKMIIAVSGDTNTTRTNCMFALDLSNTSAVKANTIYWDAPIVPTSIAYLKGYVVLNHDNTGTTNNDPYRGRFYTNIVDYTSLGNVAVGPLDYYSMSYNPGEYVKAVVTNGQYVYVFGETHYEVWYLTGTATDPLAPIQEATGRVGMFSKTSYAQYKEKIFFLGKSEKGNLGCYFVEGLENKKISTAPMDRYIQQQNVIGKALPTVMVHEFNGNVFIIFNINSRGFAFNLATGEWHEQSTETAWGNLTQPDSFALADIATATSSDYSYAMFGSSAILRLEPENPTGNGSVLTRSRTTQHISGEDSHAFHNRVRLDVEANSASSYDANVVADVYLLSSDDDGKTWYQYNKKSLSNVAYGNISGDKRMEWFRLGRSDDRIYRIFTNANTQVYISGGFADVTLGTR